MKVKNITIIMCYLIYYNRHDIAKILLKVALNIITLSLSDIIRIMHVIGFFFYYKLLFELK